MDRKTKLYDAFGEMIYVVAMADGVIQKEEYQALEEILKDHAWAREIKWSFDYEVHRQDSIEYLYSKVLNFCYQYGPSPEYQKLVEILEKVAHAGAGIDSEERMINRFAIELTERFVQDLDRLDLWRKLERGLLDE